MSDADLDLDLEAELGVAFLTPVSPERPELAAAIMRRVHRADRRRRTVILSSGLAGVAIAAAVIAATGALDPGALQAAARLAASGFSAGLLGAALIALAATRHALREI